ncbi:MAG: hypothetical protein M3014_09010 [Chloroflexota bacterium]|nr:hypothetical protein [Chloroflexota bacterium]
MDNLKTRYSRLVPALITGTVLMMSVAGIHPVSAAPAQQAGAQTFTAMMGNEIFTEQGKKSSWQADRFYAENITVNVGDTVKWKHNAGLEPHTVTFLGAANKFPDFALPECNGAPCPPPPPGAQPGGPPPPGVTIKLQLNPQVALKQGGATYDGTAYTNSGVMSSDNPGPKEYSLSFTKPGTYTYVCAVHAGQLPDGTIVGMQGKITVQAEGSAYPKTAAQSEAEGKDMMAADEKLARDAEPKAKSEMITTKPGPNGTLVHHVNVSYSLSFPTYALDYMRFAPDDIVINEGDTVEWSSPTPHTFHNVLLGEEPEAIQVEPQQAGPPKFYANSDVFMPVGPNPSTYSGSGLHSSGIIVGPEDGPGLGVPSYSLSFTQPGRYEYICGLHYHNGMDAHVTVQARTGGGQPAGGGQPVGMPSTGGNFAWTLWSLLASSLFLALSGLALRFRKAHNAK